MDPARINRIVRLAPLLVLANAPLLARQIGNPGRQFQAPTRQIELGQLRQPLPWETDQTFAVALGDIDGDGDLDALFGNTTASGWSNLENRLVLNDGHGLFTDASDQLPGRVDDTVAVALGDVDGDGDLDAYIGNLGADVLLLNDGTGRFVEGVGMLPGFVEDTSSVRFGDFDGDGDLDALVTTIGASLPDRLLTNLGAGTFVEVPGAIPGGSRVTHVVKLADLDGDGDLDLVFGLAAAPYLGLARNDSGTFTDISNTAVALNQYVLDVAIADLNGDGNPDLVTSSAITRVLLYTNGEYLLGPALPFFKYSQTATVGDFDGDGDQDLILSAFTVLLTNDGAANFTQSPFPQSLTQVQDMVTGDVDGDADLDLVVAVGSGVFASNDRLFLNDGDAGFQDAGADVETGALLNSTQAMAAADFDRDGDLDIFLGNFGDNDILLNDGSGVFVRDASVTSLGDDKTEGVAVGDFNGDGYPDVVLANWDDRNAILTSDGQGGWVRSFLSGVLADRTTACDLGDIDLDGDLDIWLGQEGYPQTGGVDSIYINNGVGGFTLKSASGIVAPRHAASGAFADIDGDGDQDLLVGYSVRVNSRVGTSYLNDGTGFFTERNANIPAIGAWNISLAIADLDGDGDLDAWFGNAARDNFFLNDGTGMFSTHNTNIPNPSIQTYGIAFGDMNGDGALDVSLTRPNEVYVYANDSTGFFARTATHQYSVKPVGAILFEDFDRDGDADLMAGKFEMTMATSLLRQLARDEKARIGKRLRLSLYGPAFGRWLLIQGSDRATLSTPSVGMLLINPATMQAAGQGYFDHEGRARYATVIPADPALVGREILWQALSGSPATFGNLEVSMISNH